ncbi:MAG: hypothetical protein WCB27_03690 [Thermoguttaceae bacterium]|jgi:hypothetical protein
MQMKLEEYIKRFPDRGQPVPSHCAGKWIAWNEDRSEILSHGQDLDSVRQEALARGWARPILQKVPHGPFVGGASGEDRGSSSF